jgi:hypothetical protein
MCYLFSSIFTFINNTHHEPNSSTLRRMSCWSLLQWNPPS